MSYISRNNVVNTTSYDNCMVKMMRTTKTAYDFQDNDQAMLVVSFEYTGPQEQPHEIDSYECEYNINHDLLVQRTRYSGVEGVTVLSYPQYQYDGQHNWTARVEELLRPTFSEPLQNATKREILYFRGQRDIGDGSFCHAFAKKRKKEPSPVSPRIHRT